MEDLTNTQAHRNLEGSTARGTTLTKLLGILAMAVTFLGMLLITWWLFFWPKAATIYEIENLTPTVTPTGAAPARRDGVVRMWVHLESSLDPACLIGTQYFIRFSDNTLAKVPGLRVTTEGAVKDAIYEAVVPLGSPPGMASFYIREAFSCGIRTEVVETPEVKFLVLEERK